MKKILLLLIITIAVINVNAQNKKEQIRILTNRIDSLYHVDSIKNLELIEKQNQITKLQQELTESKQKLMDIETQISNIKQEFSIDKRKLENTLTQNQVLTQQIIELKKPQLKHDISGVVGNSSKHYKYRVSGEWNGCMGKTGVGEDYCEEIPSDWDLYQAIIMLNTDYNNDTVIDGNDLQPAIEKIGDINKDSKTDIYDIVYPETINYTVKVQNPFAMHDDSDYILMGVIILNSDISNNDVTGNYVLKLQSVVELTDFDGNKTNVNEIWLGVSGNMIIYRNKTVVLKGRLNSGNTPAYQNGFLFSVNQIIGAVK